jgi:SM-20-related protein
MTPKQILDSFSETLMQDERILSAPERALLAALLQHAKTSSNDNPELQGAVRSVIASAVGETVAQRAFAVLGGRIVERILEGGPLATSEANGGRLADIYAGPKPSQPQPPGSPMRTPGVPSTPGQPQPPGVKKPMRDNPPGPSPHPQPPGPVTPAPLRTPAGQPQTPSHGIDTKVVSESGIGVALQPTVLPAKCVVLDEFLAPQELDELRRFTLEHEDGFSASEVISPTPDGGVVGGIVNYEHRRSRVLMDLGGFEGLMLDRIKAALPQVLQTLGMEEFSVAGAELQVTASNDGDFFRFHSDNGSDPVALRHLTFVYFFHREPRQFEGGELRIHDARLEEGRYLSEGSYQTIVPEQNQIVFFPCELLHEITPVNCSSGLFADSRFTLNGWLRR